MTHDPQSGASKQTIEQIHERIIAFPQRFKNEIGKIIIGQEEILDLMIISLFCNGHVLITGVPGLAKTLLVKTVASLFHLDFNRIQCTPDLMPSDIIGVEILDDAVHGLERKFRFVRGPVFTNLLLADEINRTSPRTQAALLQAMQEKEITVVGTTHSLQAPFIVFATQNPIDSEGTYLLPEAQLDRFLFNIFIDYPSLEQEIEIASLAPLDNGNATQSLLGHDDLIQFQRLVHDLPIPRHLVQWIVKFVRATRPQESEDDDVKRFVEWGAGVRASQSIVLASKAKALLSGHNVVSSEDIQSVLLPVLRHRIIINFVGEAETWNSDRIIQNLMEKHSFSFSD
ncbi:MAG: MoxR family ATPase [SAR324 cluster bacterium]|nr:MoxR family ATPase [SAR324 cluster bacterium]